MKPFTKRLLILLFSVSLVLPAASMLLPVEREEIDNRRLIVPEVSLRALTDPRFYLEAVAYVRDANPVRAGLVKVGAGVDFYLFDESPNPNEVLLGTDGWLYRRQLLKDFCDRPADRVVSNLTALVREIESEGATVVYTMGPPKFAVHPEHLRQEQLRLATCGIEGSDRMRDELATRASSGYVDGWALFEDLRDEGIETYFLTDTHFNYLGSIPWMEALVSAIDPDIWEPEAVVDNGTVAFEGNLAALILPGLTEEVRQLIVDRGLPRQPAERLHDQRSIDRSSTERYRARGTELPPLIESETVMLGDSYLILPTPSLVQYFRDVTVMDWRSDESVAYFLERAHSADVVVIELAAESLYERFADDSLAREFRDLGE
jgi:hypothetical protein